MHAFPSIPAAAKLLTTTLIVCLFLCGCAVESNKHTLSQLQNVQPELTEVRVEDGLDKAMDSYKRYLTDTRKTAMTPEAMRRLADLKVEKQFGLLGDGKFVEMAAPDDKNDKVDLAQSHVSKTAAANVASKQPLVTKQTGRVKPGSVQDPLTKSSRGQASEVRGAGIAGLADLSESQKDFEKRAMAGSAVPAKNDRSTLPASGKAASGKAASGKAVEDPSEAGPKEAIVLYDQLLAEYPNYEHADKVLYQKSRAYDELGRTEDAMKTMERLITAYPHSRYLDEVQFRRGEYFFTRRKFRDAEGAYDSIISRGDRSEYYELALYKLGWALYKQEFYDEALHKYIALLDHKVSIGYDFDAAHEEGDERRVADTFRVISLSFSNIGGQETVSEYFATNGKRTYEDRVYSNLAEYYFVKLRYHDAAAAYRTFIKQHPLHRSSPHFGMRIVEIYTKGGFQKLVLESKKEFASTYGLQAEYWQHFTAAESPEVLSYLKANLKDLANYYHSQYQRPDLAAEQQANFREALQWYREFLTSFPSDSESPSVNYQLADLLLERKEFAEAAKEYERTAYQYGAHEKASAAGYAAIYAYREQLKVAREEQSDTIKRSAVESSLKFADTFPQHENAASVLGAAADDLYQMKDYRPAIAAARQLVERFPNSDLQIRRSASIVIAHASFDLADYAQAESGYARVLELTPKSDAKHGAFVENLAASIYKQGEQANADKNYRDAANHFLRIKKVAPTATKIAAAAEYDAGAALIRLEDWTAAAEVLETFRRGNPEHDLVKDATKQIAFVYKQSGQVSRAAGEYERIAAESTNPEVRGEALQLAGDLHRQSNNTEQALAVYARYVAEFPRPLEAAVETRYKMAELYKQADPSRYREQLQKIVSIDATSGSERTDRTRNLAARSALVLAEQTYEQFAQVKLVQPFERSLKEKQKRMDASIKAFSALIDYRVGEVTAGATYYMAEVYYGFNRALLESERPANMKAAALQQYELDLEETAFPFEEKAIGVHEKNLELIRTGFNNVWLEKSLAKLAQLMPARYAKPEVSSGFLGSIDRYAYRSPATEFPAAQNSGQNIGQKIGSSPESASIAPIGDSSVANPSVANRLAKGAPNAIAP
jgi:tetratricopeptide (TPR) repeat protein